MVAKRRTRGRGEASKNSAAPLSVSEDGDAVPDQGENSDAGMTDPADIPTGGLAEEREATEESEVVEDATNKRFELEGAEVEEGEMEGVEGDGGENTSFEETFDIEQSIAPGEGDCTYVEDGEEFGGEELMGDGADDDGVAVDIEEENDEGVDDISWVEELWNKKKAEESEAENTCRAEEEEPTTDDFDFEMKDEAEERMDGSQKEQPEDPDKVKTSSENETVATADQGEKDEGTAVCQTTKGVFPESILSITKSNSCIPRAYFGPAFDENCFQCCVRIYPVAYVDLVRENFASILQSADSVHMRFGPRPAPRSLELFCQRSVPLVHNLMFVPHCCNVTIEIERRKPIGWKKVTRNQTTISVPTAFSSEEYTNAKFTLKSSYFRRNLCKPTPMNNHQSVKERSLFISNLPNMDGGILKHIFPLATKIALVNVSENLSSAVLTMKSHRMVLDHLVAITDVSINGQKLEMGAVNMTQEAAQKLFDKPHNRRQSERNAKKDGEKAKTGPGESQNKPSTVEQEKRDHERKERERRSRELREKERLDREKKDREQRERMQREKEREREHVQKDRPERERSRQHAEERVKTRKRELAQKEFARMAKNTRREPERSPRTGWQEDRRRQRSGGPRRRPGMPPHQERQMQHEMDIQRKREMREMERDMEFEREMEIEREMERQRELQRELEMQMEREREMLEERERREQEHWEWQDRERRKMEQVRQEEERDRRHQEELLREKEKLEKMHQDAVLKLMMVEEQQRREREELKLREHEMEMEKQRMQQQLEEERRRQQQEKEEWEHMSRKRGRVEEPGVMGLKGGNMTNKRGRGDEGPWENSFISGAGSDQLEGQRLKGKHLSPAAGPSSEDSVKRKLELEVARQAEELKKSLALLDKIQKDPLGISATFSEAHSGKEKRHRDQPSAAFGRAQQPDPQQQYREDFRPQNQQPYSEDFKTPQYDYNQGQDYNAQFQDYGRDMSHFQYPHGGGQATVTEDSYSSQYGRQDSAGHQTTTVWGAGATEAGSWPPHTDQETSGYSQPARQWTNRQRQGQPKGGQGGQPGGGQGGQPGGGQGGQPGGGQGRRQRRSQGGRQGGGPGQEGQRREGGYQQPAWQGADSDLTATEGGYDQAGRHEGGGYDLAARQGGGSVYGQMKRQGGGGYSQQGGSNYGQRKDRWSGDGSGGHYGGQGKAGNY